MFHLFRLSGCAIADMKQPFVKFGNPGKRANKGVQESVQCLLKPA